MLHIELKGLEHRAPCKYSVRTHTLNPTDGVKGQNIFFSVSSHVAYQIIGN